MDDSEALISIIVPVYNRADLIGGCIESILAQTYRKLQLILVDDGSGDQSFSVCQRYAKRDSRILVLHQENQGPGAARNTGLAAADGNYVTFVDSDDRIHPRCLELLYSAAVQTGAKLVLCELAETERWNKALPDMHLSHRIKTVPAERLQKELLYGRVPPYCWGKLWKKSILAGLRFQDISFCEDAVFSAQAMTNCVGDAAIVTGLALYFYYRHGESVTKSLSEKNFMDSLGSADMILSLSAPQSNQFRKAAVCYLINTAFFAYLNTDDDTVRRASFELIQQYRMCVLKDFFSPLKSKAACLFSCFPKSVLERAYNIFKKRC